MDDIQLYEDFSMISVDFEPLIDFLIPFFYVHLFTFGIVIALLIVIVIAKGWDSSAK